VTRTFNVINELRSLLHDNLTDPNSDRRKDNQPWVFTHQPNTSQLPTIQIKQVDSTYDTLSIGNLTQFNRSRIQISVRIRTQNEYDFDTDSELETASDGLDYLVTKVVDTIKNNHDSLISETEIKSVIPDIQSDVLELDQTDAIEKSVDFIVLIQDK